MYRAAKETILGVIALSFALAPLLVGSAWANSTRLATQTGSVSLTNQSWICDGPVNMDSVTVSIGPAVRADGIHLEKGCTGRIGQIHISTASEDGLKINDPTNLIIGGGMITCSGRLALSHQDGVQALSGTNVTITGLTINCPTSNNSAFYINQGVNSARPPQNILCSGCYLHGTLSSTVFVAAHSVTSGVVDSTICPSRLTYRKYASDAVDIRNRYPSKCPGDGSAPPSAVTPPAPASSPPPTPPTQATPPTQVPSTPAAPESSSGAGPTPGSASAMMLAPSTPVVTFGYGLTLTGRLGSPHPGRQTLALEARTQTSGQFEPLATFTTLEDGTWSSTVKPSARTAYRLRYARWTSMPVFVSVRPHIALSKSGSRFVVVATAAHTYRGRIVVLQRRTRSGAWHTLRRVVLGKKSTAAVRLALPFGLSSIRAFMSKTSAGPGYLSGSSPIVRVRR